MRFESSVRSITWIPSEAIETLMPKLPFEMGIVEYDAPPPDVLDLEQLDSHTYRFANELRAWIEVEDGRIVDYGHSGGGRIGVTKLGVGPRVVAVAAVPFPELRPEPEVAEDSVRFVQTAGGRTGIPAPRRVGRAPFVQISAPAAWTTLALTIHADGRAGHEVVGASSFPRHWIYDQSGALVAKSGVIEFEGWWREAFGAKTPWGDEDSPAVVTETETALERQLSRDLMTGGGTTGRLRIEQGDTLVEKGEEGDELFLVLDGVLAVEIDGETLAEMGPGVILGERAILEGGTRTSTLRAITPCRVAVIPSDRLKKSTMYELASTRRREEQP